MFIISVYRPFQRIVLVSHTREDWPHYVVAIVIIVLFIIRIALFFFVFVLQPVIAFFRIIRFHLLLKHYRYYWITNISLFLVSLCQGWGAARNFFTASSDSLFHPPLSLVFFFQSSSSPAFLTSLLTQSSHLSLGLPRLLLPCSRNSAALFGSLSSAILSTCPAHCRCSNVNSYRYCCILDGYASYANLAGVHLKQNFW